MSSRSVTCRSLNIDTMGRKVYYIEQRNEELWKAYEKGWYLCDTFIEAVDNAINQPCSRIWMSEDFAYRLVTHFERNGGFTDTFRGSKLRPDRIHLYQYIWDTYSSLRSREWLGRRPTFELCQEIIYQPAPRFFLSLEYAIKLIRKLSREHRKKLMDKIEK